jgi:hypothetical protein
MANQEAIQGIQITNDASITAENGLCIIGEDRQSVCRNTNFNVSG